MEKSISILGCGWLGVALAREFVDRGYTVKGSATTDSQESFDRVRSVGATPYKIALTPDINSDYNQEFFCSDIIILSYPPRRDSGNLYLEQAASIVSAIGRNPNGVVPKVLFISSTSVYPDGIGVVDESCSVEPSKPNGVAITRAEEVIRSYVSGSDSSILRLGGLIGYDRDPSRFLQSGRVVTRRGDAKVNLIHRDDVIGIVAAIIEKGYWGYTLNGVSPEHPTRRVFYTTAAKRRGLTPPIFIDDIDPVGGDSAGSCSKLESEADDMSKVVSSKRVEGDLGYSFIYPSPLDCLM